MSVVRILQGAAVVFVALLVCTAVATSPGISADEIEDIGDVEDSSAVDDAVHSATGIRVEDVEDLEDDVGDAVGAAGGGGGTTASSAAAAAATTTTTTDGVAGATADAGASAPAAAEEKEEEPLRGMHVLLNVQELETQVNSLRLHAQWLAARARGEDTLSDAELRGAVAQLEALVISMPEVEQTLGSVSGEHANAALRKEVMQAKYKNHVLMDKIKVVYASLLTYMDRHLEQARWLATDRTLLRWRHWYDMGKVAFERKMYQLTIVLQHAALHTLWQVARTEHEDGEYTEEMLDIVPSIYSYIQHSQARLGLALDAYESAKQVMQWKWDHDTFVFIKQTRVHLDADTPYETFDMPALLDTRMTQAIISERRLEMMKTNDSLVVLTVATEYDMGLDILNASVVDQGMRLHVVGLGEEFKGYGFKLKRLLQELDLLKDRYEHFLFVDAFDVILAAGAVELMAKFRAFQHPLVVSAETNCWPDPVLCAKYPQGPTRYNYLNSGAMMGETAYMIDLLRNVMKVEEKPWCIDDQHELALVYLAQPGSLVLDHKAELFMSMYESSGDILPLTRPRNKLTGSMPALFHSNGYDKSPLVTIAVAMEWWQTHYAADRMADLIVHSSHQNKTQERDSVIERCYPVSNEFAEAHYKLPLSQQADVVEDFEANNANPQFHMWTEARMDTPAVQERMEELTHNLRARDPEAAQAGGGPTAVQLVAEIRELTSQVKSWAAWGEHQEYRSFCADDMSETREPELNTCLIDPSRPDCFDFTRCKGDKLTVYVYPYNTTRRTFSYNAILDSIVNSPYYVEDPADACLFVPNIDVYCMLEECMYTAAWAEYPNTEQHPFSADLEAQLKALPHWNGGKNHLIFQKHEAPCVPFDIGAAILVKADISAFHYRPGFDVSMPYLALRDNFTEAAEETGNGNKLATTRRFTAVFKGARTMPVINVRERLLHLHDGEKYIMLSVCRIYGFIDSVCTANDPYYMDIHYDDLIADAKYGIVVEGYGYNSYRLLEVIAAGAVPVIAVDYMVLPFSSAIDWRDFAVLISESEIYQIPDILNNISDEQLLAMQAAGRRVYDEYFASLPRHVFTALEITAARVQNAVVGQVGARALPHAPSNNASELNKHYLDSEMYWPEGTGGGRMP